MGGCVLVLVWALVHFGTYPGLPWMVEAEELVIWCDLGRCSLIEGRENSPAVVVCRSGCTTRLHPSASAMGLKTTRHIVTKARRALELRVQVVPWAC